MKRQDVLSILITFVVGIFAGGYLYVTHFAKLVSPDDVQSQADIEDLVIEGEAYGGCKDVCPSFQMLSDGTYRYQFTAEVGAEKTFKEGTVPYGVRREISRALSTEALVEQSQPAEPTACNSHSDGIDVRYKITFEGAEYLLDSCGTTVDGEGDVWNSLAKIWNHFETVQ